MQSFCILLHIARHRENYSRTHSEWKICTTVLSYKNDQHVSRWRIMNMMLYVTMTIISLDETVLQGHCDNGTSTLRMMVITKSLSFLGGRIWNFFCLFYWMPLISHYQLLWYLTCIQRHLKTYNMYTQIQYILYQSICKIVFVGIC